MLIKVVGEEHFQVLSTNFLISNSNENYDLMISADGINFTPLFSVTAGNTKLCTNMSRGGFYYLRGNNSAVTVNWEKDCGGGGGGTGAGVSSINGQTGALNVKTINGNDILGTGDIEIQGGELPIASEDTLGGIKVGDNLSIDENGVLSAVGGGGDANIVELTQAEYDALEEIDPKAIYVITDAEMIDMEDYVTKEEFDEKVTETVMPELEKKANKANVTAGSGIPNWNDEGVITGSVTGSIARQNIYINGQINELWRGSTWTAGTARIFSPADAGTKGQVLTSNGSGAPVWTSQKFQFITQSDYDALATKDATTFYFIIGE